MDQPTPDQIRAERQSLGLTQTQAADLVHAHRQSWAKWERPAGDPEHRAMPLASWELYLIKSGRHPDFEALQNRRP